MTKKQKPKNEGILRAITISINGRKIIPSRGSIEAALSQTPPVTPPKKEKTP